MDTILVDSSVWINYLKNNNTKASLFIDNNNSNLLATCPVIVHEVLQGVINDNVFITLKEYFSKLVHLTDESYDLAVEAAQLYRNLRKKGITIRKPNDCLIAAYAIYNKVYLLHEDRDFTFIAANSDLKTVKL